MNTEMINIVAKGVGAICTMIMATFTLKNAINEGKEILNNKGGA